MKRSALFLASVLLSFTAVTACGMADAASFASSGGEVTVAGGGMPLPLYLEGLGRQAGKSVLVLPGTPADVVSYQFTRVSWLTAWDAVTAAHGLGYCLNDSILVVGPVAALGGVCARLGAGNPVGVPAPAGPALPAATDPVGGVGVRDAVAPVGPDLPAPVVRVPVRVRVFELADNASDALGVDWSSGLLSTVVSVAGSALLGAVPGVPVGSIGNAVSALERQGLARKLDEVQLTLTAGRPVSFTSGGTLSLSLIGGGDAKIERTIPYGLDLVLTAAPPVDGVVSVDVSAELSSAVSTSNPSLLDVSKRRVSSVVDLRGSAPALVASWVALRDERNASGLPAVSSVPVLGYVAGRADSSNGRSTVLVTLEAVK